MMGPMMLNGHIKDSRKRDNTMSGRNALDDKLGHAQGTRSAVAQTGKPGSTTTKSRRTRPVARGGTKLRLRLKPALDLRSWNRMARDPPAVLLKDPDVRRWHDNLRRSSMLTCTIRLRRLNLFCDRVGMTPRELAKMGRKDPMKAENTMLDHV